MTTLVPGVDGDLVEDFGLAATVAWRLGRHKLRCSRRQDELVVRADLPGMSKDDIKVEFQDGCLTIQGERRQESKEGGEGQGWCRSERRYGTFYRCIELPEGVTMDKVKANFKDKVLEVTLPAPFEQTQGRRIEIQS